MPTRPPRVGDVVRIRDERWSVARLIAHDASSIVEVRGCGRSNRGAVAHFLLPFEPVEPLPVSRAFKIVRPRRWQHLARGMLAAAQPTFDGLRAAARADLSILPFQLEPAMALVRGAASRILIADEVGLGKTVQAGLAIAELVDRVHEPHVLVVVPAALREQWQEELSRRFGLSAVLADSATIGRSPVAAPAEANPWATSPVLIASVDYIKRPEAIRGLETLVWDLVVFDEAHLASTRSDRHHAAAALGERARAVLLLTATPHSGNDDDFSRLCGLGDLDAHFPLLAFRRTRTDVGLTAARRTTWLRVRPTPPESRMHAALLRYTRLVWRQKGRSSPEARLVAMVLARRACSSPASLARSLERRLALMTVDAVHQLRLPLDEGGDRPPDVELGAAGLHDAEDERRQLTALLALARAGEAAPSKFAALQRLLRRAGEPAIVFTEYRDTLMWLQRQLSEFEPLLLHGDLTAGQRRDVVREFTDGPTRLLLATDAASEGLNLHHRCRLVINLELPWTPRRLDQRVGRVERIGQRRRVHEVHLLGAGTSEEITAAVLTRRSRRIRDVVDALRGIEATEQDVARSVFEDGSAIPAARDGSLPPGVFTCDLGGAAVQEAGRLVIARQLQAGSPAPDGRAFACARRARGRAPVVYWTFRTEFLDSAGEFFWDTLLPLEACLLPQAESAQLRPYLERLAGELAACAREAHVAAARSLEAALRDRLALAISRERAMLSRARHRQARLAAALAQGTLFSNRPARQLSEQAAALEQLLSHGRVRLERLVRQQTIRAGRREPAFALLRLR